MFSHVLSARARASKAANSIVYILSTATSKAAAAAATIGTTHGPDRGVNMSMHIRIIKHISVSTFWVMAQVRLAPISMDSKCVSDDHRDILNG